MWNLRGAGHESGRAVGAAACAKHRGSWVGGREMRIGFKEVSARFAEIGESVRDREAEAKSHLTSSRVQVAFPQDA